MIKAPIFIIVMVAQNLVLDSYAFLNFIDENTIMYEIL